MLPLRVRPGSARKQFQSTRPAWGATPSTEEWVAERGCKPKEIKTIRALLKSADIPVAEIAARFGIARSTLYRTILKPAA